jgi:phage-related protein
MATFTYTPSFTADLEEAPKIQRVQFGDGYEKRLAYGINTQPKTWALRFDNRTNTERDAILTFLRARGGVESFDWTDPNGTAGKFICEGWNTTQTAFNFNGITATFRQVFEP